MERSISYADHTVLIAYDTSWSGVAYKLQILLNKINLWLLDNAVSLNVSKTVVVTFGNYKDSVPRIFKLQLNNEIIRRVVNVKYMGIIIDQHLRWDIEINQKTKRLKYTVLILAKLKSSMSPTNLMTIIYGIYYSIAKFQVIA